MNSRSRPSRARVAVGVSAVIAVAAWAVMGVIALLRGGFGSSVSGVGPPIFWPVWGFAALAVALVLTFTWRSRVAAVLSLLLAIAVIGLLAYIFATGYFAGGEVVLFAAPVVAGVASLVIAVARRPV